MKKILDLICVIMFFSIIVMFAVSALFFQGAAPGSAKSQSDLEQQLSEHFPLQGSWQTLRTSILLAAGKTEIDGTFLVNSGVIKPSKQVSSSASEKLCGYINDFASQHEGQGVFVCIIPSPSGIYSADIPSVGVGFDQRGFIDDFYYGLDSSVVTLDAYSPLYASRENYIFFRTDESLTSSGAFGVYYSFIRKMGFVPRPYSDYDSEHAMIGYIGSLCTELNIRRRITPDNIELLTPKNGTVVTSVSAFDGERTDEFRSVFDRGALSGSSPLDVFCYGSRYKRLDIKTVNRDYPRLLIVKTARTDPLIPFVISHYSRVTVIDADAASGDNIDDLTDPGSFDQVLFLLDIDSIERLV